MRSLPKKAGPGGEAEITLQQPHWKLWGLKLKLFIQVRVSPTLIIRILLLKSLEHHERMLSVLINCFQLLQVLGAMVTLSQFCRKMSYFQSCQRDISIHTGFRLKKIVKFCELLEGVRAERIFIINSFLIQSSSCLRLINLGEEQWKKPELRTLSFH